MVARKSTRNSKQTTPRHLWLAALGAFAVARREASTAAEIALEELGKLRRNAVAFAGDARDIARGAAMTVQEAVNERIEPQVGRFSAEVEARLAPVLDKLGVKPAKAPARKARKPARKAARPRTAAARNKATTRVARKGRG